METRSSPNIQTLHSLARQAAIQDYHNLPKAVLFQKIQEQFNIERLQRAEAREGKIKDSKKRRIEDVPIEKPPEDAGTSDRYKKMCITRRLNKLDPIMFTPIRKRNTWKFVRPNGSAVVFNIETLVDFILASGDFSDPETRIPFSDDDLKEIDETAKKARLDKPSVYEKKKSPNAFSDMKFRRDALLGLERCAGEVVTDILTIIETCDPDEAQMRLIMRELPAFADYYRQLNDADHDFASQCMKHWRGFLHGPPNCPNDDLYGLLDVVIHYMEVCESFPRSSNNNHTSAASSSSSAASSSSSSSSSSSAAAAVGGGSAAPDIIA